MLGKIFQTFRKFQLFNKVMDSFYCFLTEVGLSINSRTAEIKIGTYKPIQSK